MFMGSTSPPEQAVIDCSKDLFAASGDKALECDELFDTAAPCPKSNYVGLPINNIAFQLLRA